MAKLRLTSVFIPSVALAVLASLAGCGLLRETPVTPQPTTVVQVTADQAAQAMDEDRFWSTYGRSALLIQGTVAALDQQPNDLIVSLATSGQTQVLCDLGTADAAIKIGDLVVVDAGCPVPVMG